MTDEEKQQRETFSMTLSAYSRELNWLDRKLYLSSLKQNVISRKIYRNEIYWCNFGVGVGSEIDKNRPSIIIQVDSYNKTSGNTIVAPITHDKGTLSCLIPIKDYKDKDGNIILDGAINISNMMCVSKARLGDKIPVTLDNEEIKNLNNAIYQHFAVDSYVKFLEKKIAQKDKYILELKEKRKNDIEFIETIKKILHINAYK